MEGGGGGGGVLGGCTNGGAFTLKFDGRHRHFLKSTCDMKPIDIGQNISGMTLVIP